jgi:MFS family permease
VAEHKPFDLNKIRSNYAMMLGNIHFLLGILTLGLAYSVVMVFNIAGPFVVENSFHFNSVVTGYCTLILGFAWMTGGILNKRFHHVEFNKKISTASVSQIILTAILLLSGLALQQLWWLVLVAFFIHVGSGFIFTVNFTHNMVTFPENAGMASGLMGGMVYVITSISSFALSQTGKIATQQDMALRYVIMSAILTIVVLLTVRLSTRWRVSRTIAG